MADIILQLPPAKKVLILSPHPDDEALGCGGTIALYAAKGTEIHVAVISDGVKVNQGDEPGEIDIVGARKHESLEAAKVLGVKHVHFLGFPDGELSSHKDEIMARIKELFSGLAPDIIFAPSPLDYHEDHRAVSAAALGLLGGPHEMKLAFYEVYNTVRPNAIVDITAVLHVKEEALMNYNRSLFGAPYVFVDVIKGLNRFRSFYAGGNGYYEAFWVIDRPLSEIEIIDWLTYAEKKEDLRVFKGAEKDSLRAILESKENIINELKTAIDAKTDILNVTALHLDEARRRIDMLEKSLFWKLATKFYRARDVLMPAGTVRRRFYDDLLCRFKK